MKTGEVSRLSLVALQYLEVRKKRRIKQKRMRRSLLEVREPWDSVVSKKPQKESGFKKSIEKIINSVVT